MKRKKSLCASVGEVERKEGSRLSKKESEKSRKRRS